MAQSPNDMGQGAGVALPQGRYSGATIIMKPGQGESVNKPAVPPRSDPLSETIPAARPLVEPPHEPDEPSIEEYMAALLARTRQYSTAPPTRADEHSPPPVVERKTPPASQLPASPSPSPAAQSPASVSSVPATGSPTPPSECRTAISELRELANISAQSSFNAHRAQFLVHEMRGKRFVAIMAMVTSVVLLSLAPTVQSPAYITAVAAVTTACAFSLKYLTLGRELAHLCSGAPPHGRPAR